MTGTVALTADDYHADRTGDERPSLSASIAHIICERSPAHARAAHPRLNPEFRRVEKREFDVGTVAHLILLEGDERAASRVRLVDENDWKKKAAQEARAEAYAAGLVPLLTRQFEDAYVMAAHVRRQLADSGHDPLPFTDGKAEQTLVWEDDGVLCRARLDWLRDDLSCIDDLKTTSASANPERWSRTLFGIGADVQAAFYLRGLAAVTGVVAWAKFRWVVVENYPPYALSVVSLAPDALALANEKVDNALAIWKRCLENDDWPAYPAEVAYAEAPAWEMARWMERDAREAA